MNRPMSNQRETKNSQDHGQVGVSLGPDLYAKLRDAANEDDRSMSNMARVIIKRYFQ